MVACRVSLLPLRVVWDKLRIWHTDERHCVQTRFARCEQRRETVCGGRPGAQRAEIPNLLKISEHAGVIEHSAINAPSHPGRDDHGGHPDPELIEVVFTLA